jgi:hypothetical protein
LILWQNTPYFQFWIQNILDILIEDSVHRIVGVYIPQTVHFTQDSFRQDLNSADIIGGFKEVPQTVLHKIQCSTYP